MEKPKKWQTFCFAGSGTLFNNLVEDIPYWDQNHEMPRTGRLDAPGVLHQLLNFKRASLPVRNKSIMNIRARELSMANRGANGPGSAVVG